MEVRSWHHLRVFMAVGFWASIMPILLRSCGLQCLLQLLTEGSEDRVPQRDEIRRAIGYTDKVLAHHPWAPNTCLLRSLILYRVLRRMGLPVHINFGVQKTEVALTGHAWLSQSHWPDFRLGNETDRFCEMYSFPPEGSAPRETKHAASNV